MQLGRYSSFAYNGQVDRPSLRSRPFHMLLLSPLPLLCRRLPIWAGIVAVWVMLHSCGCQKQASAPTKTSAKANVAVAPVKSKAAKVARPNDLSPPTKLKRAEDAAPPQPGGGFADLLTAARATEFDAPKLDDDAIAAAGIRKISGQFIAIYSDLQPVDELDELPRVFDAAVPLWCEYFSVSPERVREWKLVASVMKEKSRFAAVGLYPANLPDFPHGYNVGSQIWIYEQPSGYFRRHLLLHEGTHAFMLRWLGGAGPPWYMEGMAELLATHHWKDGRLQLAIMPRTREEVPYWGRIKMIKDDVAADRGLSLIDVMKYDAHAHLKVEAYAWCWSAAWFLDHHPLTHAAFGELQQSVRDRTLEFSKRFYDRLKNDWPAIAEDWQLFTAECDYGYDVARAAVMRKQVSELPAEGATITLATDRGWQSTGLRLSAEKKYELNASGRYTVATWPDVWPCEGGGVTIRYYRGRPLGMLLAAVSEREESAGDKTPLADPKPIGLSGELTPPATGTLFLKVNESSSDLANNTGTLNVSIREIK